MIESRIVDGAIAYATGFGVNVASSPPDLGTAATSLRAVGCEAGVADLFAHLRHTWFEWLARWDWGGNAEDVRDAWLNRAHGLGTAATVRLPDQTLTGTFERLDEMGRLVLLRADGSRRTIAAGDVFFGANK